MIPIFIEAFFGKRGYAVSPATGFVLKLSTGLPRMFYAADILEFVIDGLDERPSSEQYPAIRVH